MVVEDFQQIRPTDWLPGKRPDTIPVDVFLRPAEAGQYKFKFRGKGFPARLMLARVCSSRTKRQVRQANS